MSYKKYKTIRLCVVQRSGAIVARVSDVEAAGVGGRRRRAPVLAGGREARGDAGVEDGRPLRDVQLAFLLELAPAVGREASRRQSAGAPHQTTTLLHFTSTNSLRPSIGQPPVVDLLLASKPLCITIALSFLRSRRIDFPQSYEEQQ